MAAELIYTQLWACRTFVLVTIGFVGVAEFVFVNIRFVVVVIGFLGVPVFVFVNNRFLAVLGFRYVNIGFGASYSLVGVPPVVTCLATLV